MSWAPKKKKWNWRRFLTVEEVMILEAADDAREKWKHLNRGRAHITNRAIQRAKYAAKNKKKPPHV